jgi:SPOR domain
MAAAPPRREDDEDGPRRPLMVYALLSFLVLGMGFFLWNAYDGGSPVGSGIVRVSPGQQDFKEPGPAASEVAQAAPPVEDVLRNPEDAPVAAGEAPPPEEPNPDAAAAAPTGPPAFVNNGPFVAQIAALQAEAGIAPLWRRLSERAPDLFADARMDVQRADLGARGIYLRVRVGYFADRENASRFCVRMRAMGQDCMAVER